ncbi:MAG: glycosyltransferase family 4 protein [Deltaproteobacteria bacterium]|jgi:glycosyltransferase involved in cell wall biosynthesis|nr:glycosyltransferase family 4 protein [Deltaproteobacteria bacterium]
MTRILFIQPGYAHYRDDLFALLSQRHAIHILFEKSKNTYPGKEAPKEIDYTFVDKNFRINVIGLVYYLFKYDFDVVITSVSTSLRTIISFFYAMLCRKKFILWILEWKKPIYKKKDIKYSFRIIRHWLGKKIIINSNALVVGGTAARNYALSLGKREEDIFVAPQCSKDIQNEKQEFNKAKIKKNKYTFLFLSRIISWKGLDKLIKAFYLLRKKRNDVSLLIAGDGPLKEFCVDLCESRKSPDIQFMGSITPDKTKQVYEKGDIFVLPSYELDNYYEAWGLVVNEAMSMKLPVITTTAVGASFDMIIDGYNGFVVQADNISELYQAMNKVLGCDLIQMGINSRKVFDEKNDYAKMANGFTDAIVHVD